MLAQEEDGHLLGDYTDLVITVGGDGTILHTSNLFGAGECPPVLSFSMGSLGFLLPFRESPFPSYLPSSLSPLCLGDIRLRRRD